MKSFKTVFVVMLIMSVSLLPLSAYAEKNEDEEIKKAAQGFFRLHIRANSDTERDQELKLKVRDDILSFTTELLSDSESKEMSVSLIKENLTELKKIAEKRISDEGFDYDVTVAVRKEYFERKEYGGFFLPAGEYDSLIIEIGEGTGHNWWCVLYPCVCLSGSATGVRTDIGKVPERLRTAKKPVNGTVKFRCWLFDVFSSIFG